MLKRISDFFIADLADLTDFGDTPVTRADYASEIRWALFGCVLGRDLVANGRADMLAGGKLTAQSIKSI
jgi:hypothetical protein